MPNRNVPPDFAAIIARIHNTEHETDNEYLNFVRGLAAGAQGIAEACDDHADHLLNGIGLDPAAVKCWHDISASWAECASQQTRAEGQYLSTYQGATEDASKGVVMPYKGRFITGETG